MGFFDRLKKGLNKTRENLTNKIEKIIIGYAASTMTCSTSSRRRSSWRTSASKRRTSS